MDKTELKNMGGRDDEAAAPKTMAAGGLESASRTSREMARWNPRPQSADALINPNKGLLDARGQDMVQNDGFAFGAVAATKDSVVGAQYMLNAQPEAEILGVSDQWVESWQEAVETRFNLVSDSPFAWFDAAGKMTLTGLLRLAIASDLMTGEVLATVEWIRQNRRPFNTALQMVSSHRLCNPDLGPDTPRLRRGVERDMYGAPEAYHIRKTIPSDYSMSEPNSAYTWKRVPAFKPWGRRQVIHVFEPVLPEQTRGLSAMVAVLKEMKMKKKFSDLVLQSAVIQASFAATLQSELPAEALFGQMGGQHTPIDEQVGSYLTAMQKYHSGAKNISLDGASIPTLFPGQDLKVTPLGTPGGIGTSFEESLLRNIAAPLGMSYEQFSRDYTKTNYSSARAALVETEKSQNARKKMVADRVATEVYMLWVEEELMADRLPIPPSWKSKFDFYNPLMKEALCACTWIGASSGMIDTLKETQADVLSLQNNMTTLEDVLGKRGKDWRRTLRQRKREKALMDELGLDTEITDAAKPGANLRQSTMGGNGGGKNAESSNDEGQEDEE